MKKKFFAMLKKIGSQMWTGSEMCIQKFLMLKNLVHKSELVPQCAAAIRDKMKAEGIKELLEKFLFHFYCCLTRRPSGIKWKLKG